MPFGYVDLEAEISAAGQSRRVTDSDFNLGDIGLVPATLYWHSGEFHFKLMQLIVAPSGHYDIDNTVNVGRNY